MVRCRKRCTMSRLVVMPGLEIRVAGHLCPAMLEGSVGRALSNRKPPGLSCSHWKCHPPPCPSSKPSTAALPYVRGFRRPNLSGWVVCSICYRATVRRAIGEKAVNCG